MPGRRAGELEVPELQQARPVLMSAVQGPLHHRSDNPVIGHDFTDLLLRRTYQEERS